MRQRHSSNRLLVKLCQTVDFKKKTVAVWSSADAMLLG